MATYDEIRTTTIELAKPVQWEVNVERIRFY